MIFDQRCFSIPSLKRSPKLQCSTLIDGYRDDYNGKPLGGLP